MNIEQEISEIHDRLDSIDKALRGNGDTLGLVSRVKRLEDIHNALRVIIGALLGCSITLLAAYISRGPRP